MTLKFSNFTEAKKYPQILYLEYGSFEQSYFQLYIVRINIVRILSSNILTHYQQLIRRPDYQEHYIPKIQYTGRVTKTDY